MVGSVCGRPFLEMCIVEETVGKLGIFRFVSIVRLASLQKLHALFRCLIVTFP